jgi:molybdopterin synthase catalytic subunit
MFVSVLLFGSLREAAGAKELRVSVPEGATVADLTALLARDHAAFCGLSRRVRVSVNQQIVDTGRVLRDGDEVAYLPPVSGGGGRCRLSERPLDPDAVARLVAGPDCGGLVTFQGAVRDRARGRAIRHLEYEAYPGMAEAEMEKVCAEAEARWPGSRVAIAHRVGRLEIGELAVVVAAAAPHRDGAFAAARYAIDVLKERVPIWTKEAPERVPTAVLTVSDTRTLETDAGGALVAELLAAAGHPLVSRAIVPDEPDAIRAAALAALARPEARALIVTGGTGVAPRDVTPDALEPLRARVRLAMEKLVLPELGHLVGEASKRR